MAVVRIEDIAVGKRHRKQLGDIDALAESIAARGLIHPPVVTTDGKLVCGYRRLEAAKQLGWDEIEVRVIDPDDMLLAERDENEIREDFTISERVAIGQEIEDRAKEKERRGRPSIPPPPSEPGTNGKEIVPHGAQFQPGQKTRDVAAERAGFESRGEYERASKVVANGTSSLVEAMDAGKVSPSAAALVAELPKPQQAAVVARGPAAVKQAAKERREEKKAARKGGDSGNGRSARPVLSHDPLNHFIDELYSLIASVEAPKGQHSHGWGGIEAFAREISPGERDRICFKLEHGIERFQAWIEIIKRIEVVA